MIEERTIQFLLMSKEQKLNINWSDPIWRLVKSNLLNKSLIQPKFQAGQVQGVKVDDQYLPMLTEKGYKVRQSVLRHFRRINNAN